MTNIMRHFHVLPEPEKPLIKYFDYNRGTTTPWGSAQSAEYYGTGIVFYSTASHGGFHVSKGLLARIPEYLQKADAYADGSKGWFEEDAASAIVIVTFPERFPLEQRLGAISTMQSYYPEAWSKYVQDSIGKY